MKHQAIMRRLIWKDVLTIMPLLAAALTASVAVNPVMYALWPEADLLPFWAIPIWIMLPGIVAFGAAAMLVGTEEDDGTMDWLRTLPVRWQQVAASKVSVAIAAVLAVWAASSLVLYLISLQWDVSSRHRVILDLLSLHGVMAIGFFIALLLLLGFVTAYWIRTPLISLLVLVPIYLIAIDVCFLFPVDYVSDGSISPDSMVAGAGFLIIIWLLQRSLARRRLTLPRSTVLRQFSAVLPSRDPYRPRRLPLRWRPSQVASLLWQQVRQTAPLTLLLITIFALAAPVLLADIHLRGLSWLLVVISSSSLGALVFYGDNLHHRCSFFADRGISPTRIWWTRLLPPGIAFLVMLTIVTIVSLGVDSDPIDFPAPPTLSIVIVSVVLFAFGQLVSQWARRPILAFFAAPTYACISMSPVFYLETDPGSGSEALVVPVLLFATWRLTKRWLEGERQAAYTIRVIAYTSLAVLLPCLWISSQRMMPWIANAIGQISLLTGLMP